MRYTWIWVAIILITSAYAACPGGAPATGYDISGIVVIDSVSAAAGIDVYIEDDFGNVVVQSNGTTNTDGEYTYFLTYNADCLNLTNDSAVVAGEIIHIYLNDVMVHSDIANATVPVWVPISLVRNITYNDTMPPSSPENVSVSEIAPGIVNVSWQDATDDLAVRMYNIYRMSVPGYLPSSASYIGNTTATSFIDGNATANGSTYYYVVAALDSANIGPGSAEAAVNSTDLVAPEAPFNLNVTRLEGGDEYFYFSYNRSPSNDADRYIIWWSNDSVNYHVLQNGSYTTSYGAGGWEHGVMYYFKVQCYDAAGNPSPNSSVFNITAIDSLGPDLGGPVVAQDLRLAENSTNITWPRSLAPDCAGYRIYRNGTLIADLSGALNTGYTDLPVHDGVSYLYEVRAYDDVGNLGASSGANVIPVDDVRPGTVSASAASSDHTLNISWSAVTLNFDGSPCVDIAGYRVYGNDTGSWRIVYDGTGLFYQNDSLTNNVEYAFRITAYDEAGNEADNFSLSARPSERPQISISTGTSPAYINSGIPVNVTVQSPLGLDYAVVFVFNSSDAVIEALEGLNISDLSKSFSLNISLWDEDTYTISVWANDSLGRLNQQNFSVTVDDTVPVITGLSFAPLLVQNATTVWFNLTTTDSSGIQYVMVSTGSASVTSTTHTGDTYMVSTTAQELGCNEGICSIQVSSRDLAGNSNTAFVNVTVDNTAPSLSGAQISVSYARSSGMIVINASAYDLNGIFSVNAAGPNGTVSLSNFSALKYSAATTGATLGCSEGVCNITITATDMAGNANTAAVLQIMIDDSAPAVLAIWTNTSLSQNTFRPDESITVYANVTESLTNISFVRLADGTQMALMGGMTYSAVTTPAALGFGPGANMIYVQVNDSAGNFNDTGHLYVWIKDPANFSVSSPAYPVVVMNRTAGRYIFNLSFSLTETANCNYTLTQSRISSAPSCTVVSCNDQGCIYSCSDSGSGGGSQSISLGRNTSFSIELNLSGDYMVRAGISCVDDFGMPASTTVGYFVPRERALTLEWATIMRPLLVKGQWANFNASVTNFHNLSGINVTVTYPDNSTITTEVSFARPGGIDQNIYYNFNDTLQTGVYSMEVVAYDDAGNNVSIARTFEVYSGVNHTVNSSAGSLNASVEYLDPDTGSVINVGSSDGSAALLPNTTVELKLEFDERNVTIIVPAFNPAEINTTFAADQIESNVSVSGVLIGNDSRYVPLGGYALEIGNAIGYNTIFIVRFDYSDANVSDPTKLVIYKAPYNFSAGAPDYSAGQFYTYGSSVRPLYLNTTGQYVYIRVSSFSAFLLTEDQAESEICGDGIDNDFDGSIDEGCTSSSSSSSSSGGGGGGGGFASGGSVYSTGFNILEPGKVVNISISRNGLALTQVNFVVVNAMEDAQLTFQGLTGKPSDTAELNKVSQFLKFSAKNMLDADIKDLRFDFTVEKSWLESQNLTRNDISLYYWDGSEWKQLDTLRNPLSAESDSEEYSSFIEGFGYFAIAERTRLVAQLPEKAPEEEKADEKKEDKAKEKNKEDVTGGAAVEIPPAEPEVDVEPPAGSSRTGYIVGIFSLLLAVMALVVYEIRKHHHAEKMEKKMAEAGKGEEKPEKAAKTEDKADASTSKEDAKEGRDNKESDKGKSQ